jgi:hypothetical protein
MFILCYIIKYLYFISKLIKLLKNLLYFIIFNKIDKLYQINLSISLK